MQFKRICTDAHAIILLECEPAQPRGCRLAGPEGSGPSPSLHPLAALGLVQTLFPAVAALLSMPLPGPCGAAVVLPHAQARPPCFCHQGDSDKRRSFSRTILSPDPSLEKGLA